MWLPRVGSRAARLARCQEGGGTMMTSGASDVADNRGAVALVVSPRTATQGDARSPRALLEKVGLHVASSLACATAWRVGSGKLCARRSQMSRWRTLKQSFAERSRLSPWRMPPTTPAKGVRRRGKLWPPPARRRRAGAADRAERSNQDRQAKPIEEVWGVWLADIARTLRCSRRYGVERERYRPQRCCVPWIASSWRAASVLVTSISRTCPRVV